MGNYISCSISLKKIKPYTKPEKFLISYIISQLNHATYSFTLSKCTIVEICNKYEFYECKQMLDNALFKVLNNSSFAIIEHDNTSLKPLAYPSSKQITVIIIMTPPPPKKLDDKKSKRRNTMDGVEGVNNSASNSNSYSISSIYKVASKLNNIY